jgi:hypothetical protein
MSSIRGLWVLVPAIAVVVLGANADALERNCHYEIRVKSNGSRINSLVIPNGRVTAVGDFSTSARGGSAAKMLARTRARVAATKCFQDAVRRAGVPASCRVNRNPRHDHGAMLRYNISNLKTVALNAL